ncbi:signal recognition particle protein Srp19 [Thermococcus piezophilus]|uniref:Signal recognition particle 19 kDa protein n=1 Tax=Thermococcus piezophilus TaxID=1712654 RepID=A0A172WFE6_9EURY|nr:signal recognition particle protein Srp19 [Thermococcus piezophilus]ANF22154.1 signal recognition particle [Thermococcus piezophilus]
MRKFVVWPNELDARLSRKYGRAVGKSFAVDGPTIREIINAAESLGMKIIEVDENKLNPKLAGLDEEYRRRGMVRIESKHPKGKSLKMICQKIGEIRRTHSKGKKSKSKRRKR